MKKIIFSIIFLISFLHNSKSQVIATFSDDTVKISDNNFEWRCGAKFSSIVKKSNDTLYITEQDTMLLYDCLCYYTVTTSIIGLDTGTYTAMVTRQKKVHYPPIDTVIEYSTFAGSVTFTVMNLPTNSYNVSSYHAPCVEYPVSVFEESFVPNKFAMLTNYPNPFNPNTTIQYTIPQTSHILLAIYNLVGQQISTLVNEEQQAGNYKLNYNTHILPSGVYICLLKYDKKVLSTKIILLK